MRVLVLGATGMLGHRLLLGLGALGFDVLAGVRTDVSRTEPYRRLPVFSEVGRLIPGVDAFDPMLLRRQLEAARPDVVLNCIGVIKQVREGHEGASCVASNALLPHLVAETISGWGGWLIHFSTDCVFSGKRGGYTEDDLPDAVDLYGRSKALGEVTGSGALTIRTSFIGRELRGHHSLLDWFLAQEGGAVRGYALARFSGLTTRETVNVIAVLLRSHWGLSGLYQVASTSISKYELLHLVGDELNLAIDVTRDEGVAVDRSLIAYRFFERTGYVAPSWPEMVHGLRRDVLLYPPLGGGLAGQYLDDRRAATATGLHNWRPA